MMRSVLVCSLAFLLIFGLSLSIGSKNAEAKVIGAWLFDEGSGEVAKDSSGRDVDGVLVGSPEWVEGRFGSALKLEPNKYVDFPPPLSEKMILERDFTCMAWMNPHKWEGSWNGVFSMQAGSSNGETYGIYFSNNGGTQIQCWTKINGQAIDVNSGQGAVALNGWTHGTITYDGSVLIAYKNAEKVGETETSGDLDNGDRKGRFVINGNYNSLDGGLAEWCSSTVDEVLVFDTALSANEIRRYMENGFLAGTAVEPSDKLATAWGSIKILR
jgi:hypothetical protein